MIIDSFLASAPITVSDPWVLIVIVGAIAFLAGLIHSGIGFGFGIVAVALLPLVVEMRQSHVVISTAGVPVLMMAAWSYRQGADWASLKRALLGAAIGMPMGLFAFERLPLDWLVRGTGAAILGMVWMSHRNRQLAKRVTDHAGDHASSAVVAGGLGGFLAGAVSIAGPPVAAFALQQGWEQARFKAFVNQFLLAVSLYKVAGLAVRGFIDTSVLLQSATLAPMAIAGILVGAKVSERLPTVWFQRLVAIALVGLAIHFLING